jgi:hypothetical protein
MLREEPMKLTRKRAIEKAVEAGHRKTNSFTACAEGGVDLGIVLGLQMAAKDCLRFGNYDEQEVLSALAARRLKKLEKGK